VLRIFETVGYSVVAKLFLHVTTKENGFVVIKKGTSDPGCAVCVRRRLSTLGKKAREGKESGDNFDEIMRSNESYNEER
jgi:hypothetical protein